MIAVTWVTENTIQHLLWVWHTLKSHLLGNRMIPNHDLAWNRGRTLQKSEHVIALQTKDTAPPPRLLWRIVKVQKIMQSQAHGQSHEWTWEWFVLSCEAWCRFAGAQEDCAPLPELLSTSPTLRDSMGNRWHHWAASPITPSGNGVLHKYRCAKPRNSFWYGFHYFLQE